MRIATAISAKLVALAALAALATFAGVLALGTAAHAEDYSTLTSEAQVKYADKEYSQSLELYRKAFALGEPGLLDLYDAACSAALAGEPDQAFEYLNKGLAVGLAGSAWLQQLDGDTDLAILKTDPRWENLKTAVRIRGEEIEASFPEARAESTMIDLPAPVLKGSISVEEALENRRSIRVYADTTITLAEASQILWAAYGITQPIPDGPAFLRGGLRTAPSAGALYPLELYLVARRVDGLEPGVYWYKSETHQLMPTPGGDRWNALAEAALGQPHFETAAAAIVYSVIYERNTSKYGERGRERYVCMDVGHSAENVYLEAYALGIGTCAIGAFIDLAVKQAIGMTRPEEAIYIMPLGRMESGD